MKYYNNNEEYVSPCVNILFLNASVANCQVISTGVDVEDLGNEGNEDIYI